ncbi:MAG: hypothetical protein ACRDO9_07160, partial [Gaiellales bacterium]
PYFDARGESPLDAFAAEASKHPVVRVDLPSSRPFAERQDRAGRLVPIPEQRAAGVRKKFTEPVALSSIVSANLPPRPCGFRVQPAEATST